MTQLRDYQQTAIRSAFDEWRENTATLIVAATGTGKTTIFSDIVRRFLPQRSIVIAHREELIFQANDRLKSFGVTTDIEMGDLTATTDLFGRAQCVVATVQTLHKRLARFNPQDFGLLVIDEVHHVTAKTYLDIVNHFKQNTDLRILGVTATPDRADEEALGQIIDTVAFEYDILTAINDGWLVPVDQQVVRVSGLDFSQCRTTAGDLNGADLAMVMEAEKNLQGICGSSIEIIGDRQTILFAATVVQAEKACEIFNRHRAGMATFICGATDQETRRERVAQFRDGKVQVLTNVGVMTEGADFPAVSVAVLARPTESRSLYAQMAGRTMRVLPGVVDHLATADERKAAIAASAKPSCLLVDFVGNSGRHKLMTSADILGGKVTDAAVERAKKIVENKGGQCRMVEVLAEAEKQLREENEKRVRDEEARRAKLIAQVKYTTKKVSPFDVFGLSPARERGWDRGKTLSEKQRALLLKQGIDGDSMPIAQARQILNEIFRRWDKGLCSYKQCQILKKRGIDSSKMSREEASKAIDDIAAKEGWRNG